MNTLLDKYFNTYQYNAYHKMMLRKAAKANLNIQYMSDPELQGYQVDLIYECLVENIDPTPLLSKNLLYEEAVQLKEQLADAQGIYIKEETIASEKKQKRIIRYSILVLIFLTIGVICYCQRDYLKLYFQEMNIVLTETSVEIGLSEIATLSAYQYIETYTEDCTISLPSLPDEIGEYVLEYSISSTVRTKTKQLVMKIYDDIAPTLIIQEYVTLEYGDSYSSNDWIVEVFDNIDDVIITIESAVDTSKPGTYQVSITASDLSGNSTVKEVTVIVEEKIISSSSSSSSSNSTSSSNSSSSNSSSNSSTSTNSNSTSSSKPSNKTFLFTEYGSAEDTLSAATTYIKNASYSGTATAYPITDDNNIYIGYEVKFE